MSKMKTAAAAMPDPKRREGFEKAINFAACFWTELYSRTLDIPVMRSVFEVVQTMVALEKFHTAYDLLYAMMVFEDEDFASCTLPATEDDDLIRYFMEGIMLVSPDLIDDLEDEWNESICPLLDEKIAD